MKTSYAFVSKIDIDLDYLNLDTISEENLNQYDVFDLKHSSVGDLEKLSKFTRKSNSNGMSVIKDLQQNRA